jgi:hypothetical protein
MKPENDFYIGWQNTAPPAFAKPVRRVVIGLFVLIPTLAALLVWQQRGFSDATFEYGTLTTVEGQLIRQPVPFLRVLMPTKAGEPPVFTRILLIGLGKHGADATLDDWEKTHGSLNGKQLTVRGTRIYHEGQAALELTEQADALRAVSTPTTQPPASVAVSLGTVTLRGEITDPKCFLGVMKPGDGRPHRSCAIRCIAGGVPPLLWVSNGRDHENGYLLVGPTGEPLNGQLLAFIGKGVAMRGRLERADNWLMLYVDAPVEEVARSPHRPLPDEQAGITMCH